MKKATKSEASSKVLTKFEYQGRIYTHEVKCENDRPIFSEKKAANNKDSVSKIVKDLKQEKHIKNCANLCIQKCGNDFYPNCKQDSLIWEEIKLNDGTTQHRLIGCPQDCTYFERPLIRSCKNACCHVWEGLTNSLKWLWKAYDSQSTSVKLLILLIVLVKCVPASLNAAIEVWQKIKP